MMGMHDGFKQSLLYIRIGDETNYGGYNIKKAGASEWMVYGKTGPYNNSWRCFTPDKVIEVIETGRG